jgi:hypothetical protein
MNSSKVNLINLTQNFLIRVRFWYNSEKSFNNSTLLIEKWQPRREMKKLNSINAISLLTPAAIVAARSTLFFRKSLFLVVLFP